LEERERWLLDRKVKIKKLMKANGNLPHLVAKEMHADKQLEKIQYLKKKIT